MLISIVSRPSISRIGVMSWYASMKFWPGGRCNVMVCTCEILAWGGQLGQVKFVVTKISFSREGVT